MPRTTLAQRRERLRLRLLESGSGRRTGDDRELWRKHRGQGSGSAKGRRERVAWEALWREIDYRVSRENGPVYRVCQITTNGELTATRIQRPTT